MCQASWASKALCWSFYLLTGCQPLPLSRLLFNSWWPVTEYFFYLILKLQCCISLCILHHYMMHCDQFKSVVGMSQCDLGLLTKDFNTFLSHLSTFILDSPKLQSIVACSCFKTFCWCLSVSKFSPMSVPEGSEWFGQRPSNVYLPPQDVWFLEQWLSHRISCVHNRREVMA